MVKRARIWLITAASLVIIGLVIFAAVMTANGWDFTKLGTVKYETNTYEISDDFDSISISADTADIIFLPSDDGKCRVFCYEAEKMKHSASVQDGALTVNVNDTRRWYDYFGINFRGPEITVYLPKTEYTSLLIKSSTGDIEIPRDFKLSSIDISVSTADVKCYASATELIKIKTSTGDVRMENLSAGAIDLSASTGDTELLNISCKSLTSKADTGDITLKNVIATEGFSIERSTGDVTFDGSDAAEIFVKTDTGDVEGSLLSEKVFVVSSDTGDKDVPGTVTGGRCEITTDTGDIRINIVGK